MKIIQNRRLAYPWVIFALFSLVLLGGGVRAPLLWNLSAFVLIALSIDAFWSSEDISVPGHPIILGFIGALIWGIASAATSYCPALGFSRLSDFVAFFCFGLLIVRFWVPANAHRFHLLILLVALVQTLLWSVQLLSSQPPSGLFPSNLFYSTLWVSSAAFIALGLASAQHSSPFFGIRVLAHRPAIGRLVLALFGVFCLFVLFLIPSRTASAAATVGGFFFIARRFGRRGILYSVLGLFIAFAALSSRHWQTMMKSQDPLSMKRVSIWLSAFDGIRQRPLLGWGPGQFETLYRLNARPNEGLPVRFGLSTRWAHNDYLQIAAEWGIPAAVFFFWGFGLTLWRKKAAASEEIGQKSAAVCFAVTALFNFPLALPVNGLLAAFLLAHQPGEPNTAQVLFPSPLRKTMLVMFLPFAVVHGAVAAKEIYWITRGNVPAIRSSTEGPGVLVATEALLHTDPTSPSNVDRAERHLSRAVRFCPSNPEIWHQLFHLQFVHRKPPLMIEATRTLRNALQWNPSHAPWHVEMSRLLESAGELDGAREAAHQALRVEPHYADASLQLGHILRRIGLNTKAERWLARWPQLFGPGKVRFPLLPTAMPGLFQSGYGQAVLFFDQSQFGIERVKLKIDMKHYTEAISLLEALPDPATTERWHLKATAHYLLGDYVAAESCLRRVLEIEPDDESARQNLENLKRRRRGGHPT